MKQKNAPEVNLKAIFLKETEVTLADGFSQTKEHP